MWLSIWVCRALQAYWQGEALSRWGCLQLLHSLGWLWRRRLPRAVWHPAGKAGEDVMSQQHGAMQRQGQE